MFKPMLVTAIAVGTALGLAVLAFSAAAQQFSADLTRTGAGGIDPRPAGKLNVSNNKVRIETSDVPGGFFLVLEHFSIRLGVTRVCKISSAFCFGNSFEKRGDCSPKFLNSSRLHFT